MALIFLDTPQIDVLETAQRTDPSGYHSFLESWTRLGCNLVFTSTMQSELRRYSDSTRRAGRYRVLTDLAPIRSDVNFRFEPVVPCTLIHREIIASILSRGLVTEKGPSANQLAKLADVLPGHLKRDEATSLNFLEDESFLRIYNAAYDATRYSAMADSDSRTKNRRRVRDLPSSPPSHEDLLKGHAELERAFAPIREQAQRGELHPSVGQYLDWILNLPHDFINRIEAVGPQAALLEALPVAGIEDSNRSAMTTEELVAVNIFQNQVRLIARTFLHASKKEEAALVRAIEFAECPGSWLEQRLRLRVRRARREPRPNHYFDAERLAYLPYVDVLLTDREMAEITRQVMKDKSSPERVRAAREPLSVRSSLSALEKVLEQLALRANL